MIDAKWANEFAQEWIDSWNARDINRILSHYVDDFEMRSPIIVERMGIASGVLKGKTAVKSYRGTMVVEVLTFNDQRQVVAGSAHYAEARP
jgi:ketosteroid isomerase-like protein